MCRLFDMRKNKYLLTNYISDIEQQKTGYVHATLLLT